MNHIIDFFLWYLNLIMHFAPIIVPAAVIYCVACSQYEKRRKGRHEAVLSYAQHFGVSYEEADRLVITDHLK